jgi:adenylate cyclase
MEKMQEITAWLLGEAREIGLEELIASLAPRLRMAGVSLYRLTVHLQELHPVFIVRAYVWHDGKERAQELRYPYGDERSEGYLHSPLRVIHETGQTVRRRIEEPFEFPILSDLAQQKATEYVMFPLPFRHRQFQALSLATRRPSGFQENEIAQVEALIPALALRVELLTLERGAEMLLDTYVGHRAGQDILQGRIRRGDLQVIPAVLWYCDMRHFTKLSERLGGEELVRVLNDYFERMVAPVQEAGGEVLKFIGDAMLAIFRLPPGGPAGCGCCEAALNSAERAIANMEAWNRRRADDDLPAIEFGIALHVGEVMYGNIGAEERLDFTVIGPDVNLVTRIEGLTGKLGRALVVSAAFRACCRRPCESLGAHPLRGIAEPHEAFAPIPPSVSTRPAHDRSSRNGG